MTGSTNTVTDCTASNSSGQSVCTLSSTVAEVKEVSLLTPISVTGAKVTFIAGPVSSSLSTFTASKSLLNADGTTTSTLTATFLDAYSNLVTDRTLTVSSSRGATDTVAAVSATSNALGQATFTVLSSTEGTSILTATATDATDSTGVTLDQSLTIRFISASAAHSTITGTSGLTANGTSTSTITITLKNINDEPISGLTPTFSATDTGGSNVYSACSAGDVNGVSTCTLKSTLAESKTLSITSPVTLTGGTVVFQPGPVS